MADTVGMSAADTSHASDAPDMIDDAAHGHEPAGEPLGPIDLGAWTVAIAGGAVGILVALALYAAGQG